MRSFWYALFSRCTDVFVQMYFWQVMILRLRQLCCHPHLLLVSQIGLLTAPVSDVKAQSQTEGYEDPTLLVGSESEKELGRARKVMGSHWVAEVKIIWRQIP